MIIVFFFRQYSNISKTQVAFENLKRTIPTSYTKFMIRRSMQPTRNLSYLILSYLILSYLILSYLILSYLILSIYLSICLSVCLSVCRLSVCLSLFVIYDLQYICCICKYVCHAALLLCCRGRAEPNVDRGSGIWYKEIQVFLFQLDDDNLR